MGEAATSQILIRGARQLVTVRGSMVPRRGAELKELGIISDGAILIRDGVIQELGPTRRIENLAAAKGAIEISALGRVVMPGFVDSHTHLVFPPPSSSDAELELAARMIRTGNGQRLQIRTQAHLEAMARHGTTTVEAKTGGGTDERVEVKLLRVLGALKDAPLHVVPTLLVRLPTEDLTSDAGMHQTLEAMITGFLPKVHRRVFARFVDLAWETAPLRQELIVGTLQAARKLGFPCKIHADQMNAAEAIAMAIRHFAVAIDHLEHATAADAALLTGMGTMVTLLPSTSFCHGGRNAPARALIDAGVPVALGTDFNPQHTPTPSMQAVIALACLRLGMTPSEAISGATINGAYALGCAERVGSLDVGKKADLLILNCSDYRELGQNFGMNLVHLTMKGGEFIYKEGDVAPQAAQGCSLMNDWE